MARSWTARDGDDVDKQAAHVLRRIRVWADRSAAKAVAGRLGVGRTRHMDARFMWPQEVVRQRCPGICKIRGDLIRLDAVTMSKSLTELRDILGPVSVHVVAS